LNDIVLVGLLEKAQTVPDLFEGARRILSVNAEIIGIVGECVAYAGGQRDCRKPILKIKGVRRRSPTRRGLLQSLVAAGIKYKCRRAIIIEVLLKLVGCVIGIGRPDGVVELQAAAEESPRISTLRGRKSWRSFRETLGGCSKSAAAPAVSAKL
jgi:hypothetical protein